MRRPDPPSDGIVLPSIPALPLAPVQRSLLALVAWSVPALITVAESAALSTMAGRPFRLASTIVEAFAGWWVWALFTPLLLHMASTHRPGWPPRPGALARHVGAWLLIAIVHALVYTLASGITSPGAARPELGTLWLRAIVAWAPITVLVYAGAIGVLSALAWSRTARERERQAVELSAQLAQAQLAALRMQLHPHFLFNTLHTIGALVREGERAAALSMIAQLGELLRQVLRADVGHEVTLREELELLARYLDIEQVRFPDRMRVAWDVAPEVAGARVPTLLLQPLVENAIRHGIARRAGAGRLAITARARDGRLELLVGDDGPGLPDALQEGVGLANTRARLARLYGVAAGLAIEDGPGGGVQARVWLPLSHEHPAARAEAATPDGVRAGAHEAPRPAPARQPA